jgi:mannosyltransferase OCH1-like enzyme
VSQIESAEVIKDLYRIALKNKEANRTDDAIVCCQAIMCLNPNHVDGMMLLGSLYRETMRPFLANKCYESVLKIDPNHTWAHMFVGFFRKSLGFSRDAMKEFCLAVVSDHNMQESHFELGRSYIALEQLDSAVRAFRNVGTTKAGYWLSTIAHGRKIFDATKARISQLLSSRRKRPLRLDELLSLSEELVKIGWTSTAGRIIASCGEAAGSAAFIEAKYRLLYRTGTINDVLEYIIAAALDSHDQEIQIKMLDTQYQCTKFDDVISHLESRNNILNRSHEFRFICNIASASDKFEEFRKRLLDLGESMNFSTEVCQRLLSLAVGTRELKLHQSADIVSIHPPRADDIPFTVFQYWSSEEIPSDVARCMMTWSEKNPNLRIISYNKSQGRVFLAENYTAEIVAAFDRCYHPAMESDFLRLAYLFKNGGIYIDADEACVGPLWGPYQDWKAFDLVLVASSSTPFYLMNGFLAARPGAKLLEESLLEAVSIINNPMNLNKKIDIWDTTGPGLITRSYVRKMVSNRTPPLGVAILTFQNYRRMCLEWSHLAYKARPEGNWRF